jgi:RHS repeat-associated protein
MAKLNPLRFSTKYDDDESDFLYYGYRFYSPSTGRWLSRDQAQEGGGLNLYALVENSPINLYDILGLWDTLQHHALIDTWLKNNPPPPAHGTWDAYKWHCLVINVRQDLYDGNDTVDGVGGGLIAFCDAQSSKNSYQHEMRAYWQSVADAQGQYNAFINSQVGFSLFLHSIAVNLVVGASSSPDDEAKQFLDAAVRYIGEAQHPIADSTSPPHSGFQIWYGPIDGVRLLGASTYTAFVLAHHAAESPEVYASKGAGPANTVASQMHSKLLDVLKE